MVDYGVISTGFRPKPFAVVRDEIELAHRAKRGASIDTSTGSLDGNLIDIAAERESAIWDVLQAVVSAYDPDAATDDAQDAICALTGTTRRQAFASTVTATLCGVPGTVVALGSVVRTVSTSKDFVTQANVTITLLASWVNTTAYVIGDRRTNSTRCYRCIANGTSAGSGGPTTTAADITDGTVHWQYIGEGTGAVDVTMASVILDAIVAVAGDLTAIQSFVGGWQTAVNLTDALLGAPRQANESLRVTREAEIGDVGAGTPDAIRGAILKSAGVTACDVFRNTTDVTDANGILPHRTLALVTGGIDSAIANILFANVGSGLLTQGTTTVNITDSEGTPQPYSFSRPSPINVYLYVTLTSNPASPSRGGYPTDGDTEVKSVLSLFGQTNQTGGKDVINSSIRAAIMPVFVNGTLVAGVQGVVDAASVLVYTDVIGTPVAWTALTGYVATPGARSVVLNDDGRAYICITSGTSAASGGPTGRGTNITDGTAHWYFLGNTIVVGDFEQALLDTSRITVVSTPAGSL